MAGRTEQGDEEVAAKHDGKHARANFWVTQQNLAKQKGGRPGYQFKERKLPKVAKSVAAPAPGEEKKDETAAISATPEAPAKEG